jgi:hypothetical protein
MTTKGDIWDDDAWCHIAGDIWGDTWARRPNTLELQFSLLISIRNNENCPGRDFVHPQVDAPRVSRAQRSMKRSAMMMRCRPGTVPVRGGPGSATHRFAAARAASHPGHTIPTAPFVIPFPQFKQPFSFPRRILRPGFCIFASLTPKRGVGGAPRNVRVRARHPLDTP